MTTPSSKRGRSSRGGYHPDLHKAFNLVMRMMAIEGKSGQEGRVAKFIRQQLLKTGIPENWITTDSAHLRTPLRGDTGNLVVKIPGSYRGTRRQLTAHMDTVPICVGSQPFEKSGVVQSADPETGLGADDRAGAAVVLHTVLEITRNNYPHPPLTFLWTIQEEIGLHGARLVKLSLLGKPALAFNWDGGTAEKLTVGATGGYRLRIDVRGRASHAGGAPEQGVSAIAIAALAIADLQRSGWHGDIHHRGKHGTSNFGFIQGGEATNVVTDRVAIRAEARSHDPAFRKRIVQEIEKSFDRAAQEVKNCFGDCGSIETEGNLDYEAFQLAPKEPCIQTAERAVRRVGLTPQHAVANGGLDANWLTARGIPTVSLGCGQLNQHMTSESLDVEAFHNACRIALCLATGSERQE